MKNLVLVGLPGSGKSKLGKILASALGYELVDLDTRIEEASKRSIPELFEEGENVFRDWESHVLRESLKEDETVISTGGGVVEREQNRQMLAEECVVFLDVPLEEAILRAMRSDKRPLLQGDVREKLTNLSKRRMHMYRGVANVIVPVDERPAPENAQSVLDALPEEFGK